MQILLTRRPEARTSSGRDVITRRDEPDKPKTSLLLPIHQALILVLFTTVIGFGSALYGQQRNHYRFQLQGVTDAAEAKMVTDILRPVFNTEAEPYAVFPAFNDQYDRFDFLADLFVTREQLEAVLTAQGIVLTEFSNTSDATPENEKQ
jgi:hypothetical protein